MGKSGWRWSGSVVLVALGTFAPMAVMKVGEAPPRAQAHVLRSVPVPVRPTLELASGDPVPLVMESTFAAWMADAKSVAVRVNSGRRRGSGTVVSEHQVLTAAHVVMDEVRAVVTLSNGDEVDARVTARDVNRDLALLTLTRSMDRCLPIARTAPRSGDWVAAAGFVGGVERELPATGTVGVVIDSTKFLVVRLGIAHGMSGGPVLANTGEIVGVLTRTDSATPALASDAMFADVHCASPPSARTPAMLHVDPAHDVEARDHALLRLSSRSGRPAHVESVVTLKNGPIVLRGVAVDSEHVVTSLDEWMAQSHDCSMLRLEGHEGTACTDVVAEGELMRVRFPSAHLVALTGPIGVVASGSIVHSADARSAGVVDAVVRPGVVSPYMPPMSEHVCGTMQNWRTMQNPRVTLGSVFAHDAIATRGELLVDAQDRPVGIVVGNHVDGRGYAVPIESAIARFH